MTQKQHFKHGQVMIFGLLMFFVTIAAFMILLPVLNNFIDIGINATVNMTHGTTLALIINYMPVFMGLVILISLFALVAVR